MVTEFVVKVVSTPHAPHSQPKKWSQCGVRCVHTTLHQLSGATPKIVKKVVCFPPPEGSYLTPQTMLRVEINMFNIVYTLQTCFSSIWIVTASRKQRFYGRKMGRGVR